MATTYTLREDHSSGLISLSNVALCAIQESDGPLTRTILKKLLKHRFVRWHTKTLKILERYLRGDFSESIQRIKDQLITLRNRMRAIQDSENKKCRKILKRIKQASKALRQQIRDDDPTELELDDDNHPPPDTETLSSIVKFVFKESGRVGPFNEGRLKDNLGERKDIGWTRSVNYTTKSELREQLQKIDDRICELSVSRIYQNGLVYGQIRQILRGIARET